MSDELLQPRLLETRSPPPPRRPRLWRWLLLILPLLAGWLILLRTLSPAPPPPPPLPTPTPAPEVDPAPQAGAEAERSALLLELQALRPLQPERWAADTWQALLDAQSRGNSAMAGNRYTEARDAYQEARTHAEGLRLLQPEAPDRLWQSANTAYAAGDSPNALADLALLLQLRPGDAAATALRPRAEQAHLTHAELQQGRHALHDGALDQAWLQLRAARLRDPDFPGLAPAWEALQTAMALDRTRAEAAAERLASRIREATERAEAGNPAAAVELWLTLEADLDPETYARTLNRWSDWARLQARIQSASRQLRHDTSRSLAEQLRADPPAGLPPPLAQQVHAFLEAWDLAHQPVSVRLLSDGETSVIIERHRRLEPFTSLTLPLLPGNYVATGFRLGYRDVRIPFTVPPGAESFTLEIRVTEPIR